LASAFCASISAVRSSTSFNPAGLIVGRSYRRMFLSESRYLIPVRAGDRLFGIMRLPQ
jgi:hypothetical protein